MKNIISLSLFSLVVTLSSYSFAQGPRQTEVLLKDQSDSTQLLAYPLNVMSVIDNKCLGCHNPDARGDKSKKALQWVQLQSMEAVDLIAKLDEIQEVLEEGSMPPEKMLERFPDKKLTKEETAMLKSWAEETLNGLLDE